MPLDLAIPIGIAYAAVCVCVLWIIRRTMTPVSRERAAHAVRDLPREYRILATKEMDLTRGAGITLTRRRMRFIVRCTERLAREHGAID